MAQPAKKKVYPKKPSAELPVEGLAHLRAKVASGSASFEERDLARRCLSHYREKYRNGNLSTRAALRAGLIDARGNETA
jgi:hypothetical protein